jgi:hypothetical protein
MQAVVHCSFSFLKSLDLSVYYVMAFSQIGILHVPRIHQTPCPKEAVEALEPHELLVIGQSVPLTRSDGHHEIGDILQIGKQAGIEEFVAQASQRGCDSVLKCHVFSTQLTVIILIRIRCGSSVRCPHILPWISCRRRVNPFAFKRLPPVQRFITASCADRQNKASLNVFKARLPGYERPPAHD